MDEHVWITGPSTVEEGLRWAVGRLSMKDSIDPACVKFTYCDTKATKPVNDHLHTQEKHRFFENNADNYCLFYLVTKFPYRYMDDPEGKVSRRFFSDEQVYNRSWTLSYLHLPDTFESKTILLVPYSEVVELIKEIETEFNVVAWVPVFPFTISFSESEKVKPIPLGTSKSKLDVEKLKNSIGDASGACLSICSTAYKFRCEQSIEATRANPTNGRKNDKSSFYSYGKNVRELETVYPYFGLDQQTHDPLAARWDSKPILAPFDVNQPATQSCSKDPIFICIDVEAFERNHSLVTEIGVSTLDTRDLTNLVPGPRGQNWTTKIRSRHFRIQERTRLVNKKFCPGYPDCFQFGNSEFVRLARAPLAVDNCFRWPFSNRKNYKGVTPGNRAAHDQADRKIILLGHDVTGDIKYLSDLGCATFKDWSSPQASSNIIEVLDTAVLDRAREKQKNARSLGRVCSEYDIPTSYLHNAGNDARYTLEALIAMVIKSRSEESGERDNATWYDDGVKWEERGWDGVFTEVSPEWQEIETEAVPGWGDGS